MMTPFRKTALALVLAALFAQTTASFADEIQDRTIVVGNQTFRYHSADSEGPPIVLLHGWPQSAEEFRDIIPRLAKNHIIYAADLSGIGGTTAPDQNWRKEALAQDIKGFVDAMGIKNPLLVGHDIGGMVAYAYARQFPDDLSGLAILDVPIPGLAPWDNVATSHFAWHFDFHNQQGLAEELVIGQQQQYFRYFINSTAANPEAISDADVAVYAQAYGTTEQLRAGFELYRAFDDDAAFFLSQNGRLELPMLVVGAEYSTQPILPVMAESFARVGAANITTSAIRGSGHWLAEEQPEATTAAILQFATQVFGQ